MASKRKRNYDREYAQYHGRPEQIKRRAARNKSRRILGQPKGEVEHKDGNPENMSRSNLTVTSSAFQRRQGGLKTQRLRKRGKK